MTGAEQPSRDPIDWVERQQHVRATHAVDGSTHAVGRVLAYSEQPQVLIETKDGQRVWWQVQLCEPVQGEQP